MLPRVHGVFRAVYDPELRFTPSGMAVTKLRAVASSRKKQDNGEWVDDKTVWVNIVVFKQVAENVAESVKKGDLVLVDGRLQVDEWEDKEGTKRTSVEIVADSIGPSLAYATASTSKVERGDGGSAGAEDPWATPATSNQEEEPPF